MVRSRETLDKILPLVLVLIFSLLFLRLVPLGTGSPRLVLAFDMDEAKSQQLVGKMYFHNKPLYFITHPHLYIDTTYFITTLVGKIRKIDTRDIVLIQRGMSLFFLIATLSVLLLEFSNKGMRKSLLVFVMLFFLSASFLWDYAVKCHPDMMMVFFLVWSLCFLSRYLDEGNTRDIVFSVVLAAAAAAAKYVGVFVLLLIVVCLVYRMCQEKGGELSARRKIFLGLSGIVVIAIGTVCFFRANSMTYLDTVRMYVKSGVYISPVLREVHRRLILLLVLSSIACLGMGTLIMYSLLLRKVFLQRILSGIMELSIGFFSFLFLFTPTALIDFQIVQGVFYETALSSGDGKISLYRNLVEFFRYNFGESLLQGTVFALAGFVSIGNLVSFLFRKRSINSGKEMEIVFSVFYLLYSAYFFSGVEFSKEYSYYFLPATVPAVVIVFLAIKRIYSNFFIRESRIRLVFLLIVLLLFMGQAVQFGNWNHKMFHKLETSEMVKAGKWLEGNVPATYKVLADYHTYVPDRFATVRFVSVPSPRDITEFDPGVVIVSNEMERRYMGKTPFQFRGANAVSDRDSPRLYYSGIESGSFGFKLVKSFTGIKIYLKNEENSLQ